MYRMSCKQLLSILLTVLLVFNSLNGMASMAVGNEHGRIVYSRGQLLDISNNLPADVTAVMELPELPEEMRRHQRRRGRRGGVRARCRRRGCRVPVPTVITGNVRSLRNKADELTGLTRWNYVYREASVICLTETWLQEDKDPDCAFNMDGYTLVRGDRDSNKTGKTTGGGVAAYVNSRWAKDITVFDKLSVADIECLTLSIRPFYLPREFTKVFITIVYIPPNANVKNAEQILHNIVIKTENDNPDAIKIVTGDFNSCQFDKCIPVYQQYINFATRDDKLLDLFYCNIPNAYITRKLHCLGISDHNMCLCMPVYKQKLKLCKPTTQTVYVWDDCVKDVLLGCMECTDFNVLFDENTCLDRNVDVLTSYLQFCVNMIVPSKTVKCYANNKPWVTKELKALLNKKKQLLYNKDRPQLKIVQVEINKMIVDCKGNYKRKVECMFKGDIKSAWNGLRKLTGMGSKKTIVHNEDRNCEDLVNDLNVFYTRFDKHDFSSECNTMRSDHINRLYDNPNISISEESVLKCLQSIKICKAAGPDKISGSLLKLCSRPLSSILSKVYQQSLDICKIPQLWKTSEIIPVPKKNTPTCHNDYRPVALTPIMMKCFEKIVKTLLHDQVKDSMDCFQFAYTKNRCVEDAVLSLVDNVLKHVDKPNTGDYKYYAKILFIDFSSAFNTIQPHLMMEKLGILNVHPRLILWIHDFLTERLQYVKFLGKISEYRITNTGAPQGCVLSPLLFTIYTSDCRSQNENCTIYKYADDTAIVGLCINNDDSYRKETESFTNWCVDNFLELKLKKW